MVDSSFLPNELIDIRSQIVQMELQKEKKAEIIYDGVLLGITRSSLNTESFISASSFRNSTGINRCGHTREV